MSLGVQQYAGNFLTIWRTVSFSRTLFHGLVRPLCVARLVAVQPNTTFASKSSKRSNLWQSTLCTSKTTDETAYISHETVTSSKATPFLRKPNLNLHHRSQHHQMATMNSRGTDAAVGIPVMTTATRALCILPPFFCSFTDTACNIIKVQCPFRRKSNNNFRSNSNKQNSSIIWPFRLFYEDFFPPNFQLPSRESQRSLRCHTFSQSFHV